MQSGSVNSVLGVTACTLGIFIGDYLLFLTGKELHGFLKKRESFQFLFQSESYSEFSKKLENNFAKTIILARFMPGTRLPIYTFAGMVSKSSLPFLVYTFIASMIWTPIMVALAYLYGETFKKFYNSNQLYLFLFLTIISCFLSYQLILISLQKEKRKKFRISFLKISKLEFWPTWIFYLPLVPYVCYLILRFGSIRNVAISNPGILFGGIAFESKSAILSMLHSEKIARFQLLSQTKIKAIDQMIQFAIGECGGAFPLILKPDIGERGSGVKLVDNEKSLKDQLKLTQVDLILQEYHPGPFEAGVFYFRFPNEKKGKILSITDKVFPKLIGDGKSKIKELISNHPRYVYQESTFLRRMHLSLDVIPKEGEEISLGFAGNHIQGCLFRDGSYLITEQLSNEIDKISQTFNGFYFGRYDIRYSSIEELKLGKNFKIIELNGAMSESTNLYDPDFSIIRSYQILFKQWKILFQVGKQNYKLGVPYPSYQAFFKMMQEYSHYKKKLDPIASHIN